MSICNTLPPITSITQRDQSYVDSVLPAVGVQRNDDGRLTTSSLEAIYRQLVISNKLVSLDKYNESLSQITKGTREQTKLILETIGQKESSTFTNIQNEFCYYYVRYKFCLNDLFNSLVTVSSGTTLTTDQQNEIQTKLNKAGEFNNKLNDLIQITNFIAVKRSEEMRQENTNINELNSSISTIYGKLANQNKILEEQDAASHLKKRMVEFTKEKNTSATNLLGLYGFLNLVSIGLLFYIATK